MAPTINSIPSEVLARVLSEASCYCTSCPTYELPSPILSPISFSAVCRRWRQIALSHRSLWTHIDLAFDILGDNDKFHFPGVWLTHSKGAPLFVCITQPRIYDEAHRADEDEESMLSLFPDNQREPAPNLRRLLNFLSPLMPQVYSLTTTISWPYDSTLAMLVDCWVTHGTPGQAKILKSQANPELSNLVIRSSPASRSFLESLQVLHLHNTVLSWPEFAFGNLVELEIEMGEGKWTMSLPELATLLASCPRLQHLGLDGPTIIPFPTPNPKPILLNDLRVLRIAGFHDLYRDDGAAKFESVLAMIRPGQNIMKLDISLAYVSKSSQQAIEAVCSFVNRSNVTTLRIQAHQISHFWTDPYFASQLGPLPRVQTLILDEWAFSDVVRCNEDFEPRTYENPCPINTNQVLWPQVQNLYIQRCILERDHLMRLISLHSIQTFSMRNCNDGSESRWRFSKETSGFKDYERLLSQVVPKVVYYPIPWGSWPFVMP